VFSFGVRVEKVRGAAFVVRTVAPGKTVSDYRPLSNREPRTPNTNLETEHEVRSEKREV
jgi:hypothetical protein